MAIRGLVGGSVPAHAKARRIPSSGREEYRSPGAKPRIF
jgi:hypothetical protein